jgi:hypothetical protein
MLVTTFTITPSTDHQHRWVTLYNSRGVQEQIRLDAVSKVSPQRKGDGWVVIVSTGQKVHVVDCSESVAQQLLSSLQ